MSYLSVAFEKPVALTTLVDLLSAVPGFSLLGDWIAHQQEKMFERGLAPDCTPWQSLMDDWGDRQVHRVRLVVSGFGTFEGRLFDQGLLVSSANASALTMDHPQLHSIRSQLERVAVLEQFEVG